MPFSIQKLSIFRYFTLYYRQLKNCSCPEKIIFTDRRATESYSATHSKNVYIYCTDKVVHVSTEFHHTFTLSGDNTRRKNTRYVYLWRKIKTNLQITFIRHLIQIITDEWHVGNFIILVIIMYKANLCQLILQFKSLDPIHDKILWQFFQSYTHQTYKEIQNKKTIQH